MGFITRPLYQQLAPGDEEEVGCHGRQEAKPGRDHSLRLVGYKLHRVQGVGNGAYGEPRREHTGGTGFRAYKEARDVVFQTWHGNGSRIDSRLAHEA